MNDLREAQILHRVIFTCGVTQKRKCTRQNLAHWKIWIRIQQVLNAIPNDILLKVFRSIPGRLMKLVEANGAYVEI